MNLLTRCSFVLLFFVLGVAFTGASNGVDETPTKPLPDVTVQALGGDLVDIVEHYGGNGKITVFSFWATWCAPCKK